jgi:hypothetical protein
MSNRALPRTPSGIPQFRLERLANVVAMDPVRWRDFASSDPILAEHVEARLRRAPSYLATVRRDGGPRVHPVGPLILRDGSLVVVMYPTSPKGHDLRRTGRYALHCGVEDSSGGGGEVLLSGIAVEAAPSESDRVSGYVAFELLVGDVLATRYEGDAQLPVRTRWQAAHEGSRE